MRLDFSAVRSFDGARITGFNRSRMGLVDFRSHHGHPRPIDDERRLPLPDCCLGSIPANVVAGDDGTGWAHLV